MSNESRQQWRETCLLLESIVHRLDRLILLAEESRKQANERLAEVRARELAQDRERKEREERLKNLQIGELQPIPPDPLETETRELYGLVKTWVNEQREWLNEQREYMKAMRKDG